MTEETLFTKQRNGRYKPWGNVDHCTDVMKAGQYRLVYCPEDGHRRYYYDITPDTAPLMAAYAVAHYAMEEAILERAKYRSSTPELYSPEQQALIKEFQQKMADAGALMPSYWIDSTAYDIAKAGADALKAIAAFQNDGLSH